MDFPNYVQIDLKNRVITAVSIMGRKEVLQFYSEEEFRRALSVCYERINSNKIFLKNT
jgi:predicted ATP-grasp superfamily ATP-dependent carboligase